MSDIQTYDLLEETGELQNLSEILVEEVADISDTILDEIKSIAKWYGLEIKNVGTSVVRYLINTHRYKYPTDNLRNTEKNIVDLCRDINFNIS